MPTLNIDGVGRVTVDDSFLKLSPEEQQRTVEEIAGNKGGQTVAQPPAYSGSILPFSKDAQGNVSFDSNAGLFGVAKDIGKNIYSAATLPGDVYQGKVEAYPGLTSDETIGRTAEAAALVSPVNPAIRSGDRLIPGVARQALKTVEPKAPTAAALKTAGGAAREEARGLGVVYSGDVVADLARRMQDELIQGSINSEIAPQVFRVLNRRVNAPSIAAKQGGTAVFDVSDMLTLRQALRDARLDFTHPQQKLAADKVIAELDRFLERPSDAGVVAGPAGRVGDILAEGNRNYAAGKRSERLTGTAQERAEGRAGILPKAESRAAVANSGLNLDNTIRTRVEALLDNPRLSAGFSPEELAKLEQVAKGTGKRNTLRYIGNLLGGGGGLGAYVTGPLSGGIAGTAMGGPTGTLIGTLVGGIPPAIGATAKVMGNRGTAKALKAVDEAVRKRSPLYEALLKQAPQTVKTPEGRAALVRALMMTPVPPIPQTDPYSPFKT